MNNNITDQFNSVSKIYDEQRRYFIPCFDDFYTIALPIVRSLPNAKRVLDIGAGTGLFTKFIHEEPFTKYHFNLAVTFFTDRFKVY